MANAKIAFFDSKPYDKRYFNELNKEYGFDIKYYSSHLTVDNLILAKDFDVVCVFVNDIITSDMINMLYDYGVKLIALRCAGFNNVDFESAYEKIHIVRVPAYSPHAIAEHTISLIMTLNRKTHRAYNRTREANFSLNGLIGFDMYNKKAGVIGTGRIGKMLIKILRGFDMEVLAYDKFPDKEFETESGCTYVSEDELFAQSDIISLNCPLTKETEHLINKKNIAKMKDGVMIINTGRGKLINTSDLVEGLKEGKVGYAGLDVYEEESDLFFEDKSDEVLTDDTLARLLTFNNVIITSHQAFFTNEALTQIAATTMDNIYKFVNDDLDYTKNEVCYRCIKYPDKCDPKSKRKCF